MRKKAALLVKCGKVAPSIAIAVSYELDRYFQWDGDGPDPSEEGYNPYDVTVKASTIANGEELHGEAHLGGTYEKSVSEADPEINGYLNQMVDEALDELAKQPVSKNIIVQIKKAQTCLQREREHSYRKQMAGK
jgi:hypothetical protein